MFCTLVHDQGRKRNKSQPFSSWSRNRKVHIHLCDILLIISFQVFVAEVSIKLQEFFELIISFQVFVAEVSIKLQEFYEGFSALVVHDLRHRREGHVAMSSSVTTIGYEEKRIYAWKTVPWLASHYCRLCFPGCLGLLLVCAAYAAPAGRLLGWVLLPLLKFPLPWQGIAVLLARHTLHCGQHLVMHGQ